MSLSLYSSIAEAAPPWLDLDIAHETPPGVVRDVAALVSRTSRDPGRALAVLDLLCRSPRPMSRKRLGDELGVPAAALGRTIALLDENGFVSWTKRFGIGLGVRFGEYGEPFTDHLDRGFFSLVAPYLDLLASEHGGTAFIALRAGESMLVPRASGRDARLSVSADASCLRMAEGATTRPWSSVEPWVFRPEAGVWATGAEGGQVAVAARVTLAHSAASIGVRTSLTTPDAHADLCRALSQSAAQLTSALRRQFPH